MSNKNKRRFGSFWVCPNCKDNPELEHKEMMAHFKDAHSIDPGTTKGNKSMLMHVDGDAWYSYQYEWTIGGLKFIQNQYYERTGDNLAMWGGE